jgi:hypothetical protein
MSVIVSKGVRAPGGSSREDDASVASCEGDEKDDESERSDSDGGDGD